MSKYSCEGLDSIATLLLEKSRAAGNRFYEGNAHFYLSYFTSDLPENERKKRLRHLDLAERIGNELDNDTLLAKVYNQRGVWELTSTYNPVTAQYWFNRSIEKAAALKKRHFSIPAEMNMSEAYRMNGDTMGIKYDRDLFDYAGRHNEPMLKFLSGLHCAMYYSVIVKDTAELSQYVNAIRLMEKENPGVSDMVYANFFYNKGRYREAEEFILKAGPDNYLDFQLLYAKILNKLGKYRESQMLADSVAPYPQRMSFKSYEEVLKLRAVNMEALGDHHAAYSALKYYVNYKDSLQQTRGEDLLKRYRIEYEVVAKDREIAGQKMKIRTMVFAISGIALFLVAALLVYMFWHRRRNKFYKDIVSQNREFINRQDLLEKSIAMRDSTIIGLESRIHELESREPDKGKAVGGKTSGSGEAVREENGEIQENGAGQTGSISNEKSDVIFDRIRHLADNEQVWRDTGITREVFAEKVGCNRTYLTDVLKAKTGMGYSQFMNSCRIREAVRVLADPHSTVSLKDLSSAIGFLTIQTFYNSFRQQIGMSPAAFRKAALSEASTAV